MENNGHSSISTEWTDEHMDLNSTFYEGLPDPLKFTPITLSSELKIHY
jgi:hypothetical protein